MALTSHRGGRIAGFDGLRAVSVLLVFAGHKMVNGLSLLRDFKDPLPLGSMGVRIFFVLSGFLIVGILHRQRADVEAGARVRDELGAFWVRRSLRILPIYFLTLAVITILALTQWGLAFWQQGLAWYWLFLENFYLYFQGLQTGSLQWGDFSHLWSVAVEQQFYAIAGFALLILPGRHHAPVLWVTLVLALANVLISALTGSGRLAYVLPLPNFAFMAAGGLLAVGAWRGASTFWPAFWGFMLLLLLLLPFLRLPLDDNIWVATVFALEFVTAVNLISYVSCNQHSRLVRLLEWAPLQGLGVISYGFYLYHFFVPPLWEVMAWANLGTPTRGQKLLWTPVQLFLTVAISLLSWRLIEKPVLGLAPTRRGRSPHDRPAVSPTSRVS